MGMFGRLSMNGDARVGSPPRADTSRTGLAAPRTSTIGALQGLRAVAALMVVTVHAVPSFVIGQAGVDIFFVVSGFIMVYASERAFGQPGAPALFITRRLIRIAPLYWATTAVLLVEMLWKYRGLEAAHESVEYVLASFLFIPYPGPDGIVSPLHGVGWTLNYEMFFYAIFAVALRFRAHLATALVILLLAVVAALHVALPDLPIQLQFWSDPIILEFALGVAIATVLRRTGDWPRPIGPLLLLASCGWFGWLAVHASGGSPRLVEWGLPAALAIMGAATMRELADGKLRRLMLFAGDASYALYLTHTLTLAAIARLFPGAWPEHAARSPLEAIILVGASVVVAALAYILFDAPVTKSLQRRLKLRARPAKS
jgi:exopolysaccharide production protein ExoZ